ncbi:transglycosylase SLT domain-containing protein [Caballeronia grimmiae]|uniref:transglycosylase SLT domain-containing protein n=1 Tax=Caballeronia grimmiae TaxID=1071679 RepID=UPI0038B8E494
MADSGGHPIIKIDVDTEQFDGFAQKWQQYRQTLEEQPVQWRAVNSEVTELATGFEAAANEFNKIERAAASRSLTAGVHVIETSAERTRKSWTTISREIEKSAKGLSGIARMSLSLGSLNRLPGIFGAAGGVLAAGFGMAEKASDDLAAQNKANRALGLKPGEEQAFDVDYAKAGGDSALLAKIANAKSDPREWRYLMAAGISADDIKNKGTPDLAAEFLEKAGAAFKAQGPNAGMWADAVGLTHITDTNALRLASTYGPTDYAEMRDKYRADVPRLAVQQSTLDDASKAKADFDAGWAQLKTEFLRAGAALIPMATKLTHSAAEMMDAFDKWGGVGKVATEVGKDLTLLGEAADPFIQVLSNGLKAIAPLLPSVGKPGDKADDYVSGVIKDAPGVLLDSKRWKALRDGFEHPTILKGQDAPAAHWDWKHPFGVLRHDDAPKFVADPNRAEHIKQLEQRYGLPDGLLDRMEYKESSYGKHLRGPVLKDGQQAKGPMQFLDATAKRYGLSNPDNEADSLDASARYLSDLKTQYHDVRKAVAAYNGARFNASDANWEQNIPSETKDYLAYTLPNKQSAPTGDFWARALGTLPTTREEEAERQHQRQLELVRAATPRVGYGGGPQSPFNINVNVSTPPGSNTAITAGGLPQ